MSLALAVAALVASVLLLLQFKGRLLPIIALVASGVEVLMALGVLRLDLRGLPLGLVLAGALAVSGVMMYLRAGPKTVVASTTCVALVGVVQVLVALRLVH